MCNIGDQKYFKLVNFRTLLLYEHSDLVVIAGASALFTSTGGPAKVPYRCITFEECSLSLKLFSQSTCSRPCNANDNTCFVV